MKLTIPSPNHSPEFDLDVKETKHFSKKNDLKDYVFFIEQIGNKFKIVTTVRDIDQVVEFLKRYTFFASADFSDENREYVQDKIATSLIPISLSIAKEL